jgi:hypothetical protein
VKLSVGEVDVLGIDVGDDGDERTEYLYVFEVSLRE